MYQQEKKNTKWNLYQMANQNLPKKKKSSKWKKVPNKMYQMDNLKVPNEKKKYQMNVPFGTFRDLGWPFGTKMYQMVRL